MKFLITLLMLCSALSAQAEMGFYKKDDTRFPEAVRQASESVFQVVVPSSQTYEVYQRSEYNTETFKNNLAALVAAKKEMQYGQINFCVRNDLPVCLVYNDISISTAFVVFDSHHLATNRHADELYLINMYKELKKIGYSDAEALAVFKKYPIPMKIAKDFSVIGDVGSKHVEYGRWFNTTPFIDGHEGIDYSATDIMIIKVEKEVGKPLPIAKKIPAVGEKFFIVGYPGTTHNRMEQFKLPDSNGLFEISISSGVVESLDRGFERIASLGSRVRDAYEAIKNDTTPGEQNLRAKWNKVMFSDADSNEGGSGSPYLNAQGEVVGIHSIGLIEYRGSSPGLTVSIGVVWPFEQAPEDDFQVMNF